MEAEQYKEYHHSLSDGFIRANVTYNPVKKLNNGSVYMYRLKLAYSNNLRD
jgi:hypothetical protein